MKLNLWKTVKVGLAFFTITIFWEAYDNLMPLMLDKLGLDKTLTGLIMALDNVLALVLLPFMGLWSDRTRTKFGRRIPFIVVGSCLAALTMLLMNFAYNQEMLWLMIACTSFLLVFMCFYRTPAVSLMPDVTPKPIRSKANAVINIMGLIGGVTFLVLTQFGALYNVEKKTIMTDAGEVTERFLASNNWALFAIVSVLMIAAALYMFFCVKENQLVSEREQAEKELGLTEEPETADAAQSEAADGLAPAEKLGFFARLKANFNEMDAAQRRSLIFLLCSVFLWFFGYNAAKTWFSTVTLKLLKTDNFGFPLIVANIAGFAMYIPSSIIATKIGRRNTVILGLLFMVFGLSLASIGVFFVKSEAITKALFIVVFVFVGAGWATLNVHSYVMSVEMASKHNTGFFTGLYYTFSMSAQALTPVVSGALMESSFGYEVLFPYSLFFVAASIVTMLFVKHCNAKVIDNRPVLEKLDTPD